MRSAWAAFLLAGSAALAESGAVNIHVEPAASLALNDPNGALLGSSASLKVDTTAFGGGGMFAPQLEGFTFSFPSRRVLPDSYTLGAGVGVRARLFDDRAGYLLHLGDGAGHQGNLFGNLYLDADLTLAGGGVGVGFDTSLGAELSLVDGFQVGPFVRFAQSGPASALIGGLSITIGVPDSGERHDADADRDGVPIPADKCPEQPEDKDGFQDDDGCPEADNDGDGVLDPSDRCANVAGPAANFGCPETDRDGDGVNDREDHCPDQPGPKARFGCPVMDRDADGVPDDVDRCPDEPETKNGKDDEDGCPEKEAEVFIEREKIVITDKIFFEFGKSRILPQSDPLLKNVAELLAKFPEVKRIRIEGHTDDVGGDDVNLELSQKRAESVRDARVKTAGGPDRLETKGYGKSKPLEPGVTDAARERNRRVEFVILDQAASSPKTAPSPSPAPSP
jgi:outer membrane protein OmpA-like peptidoglycan-associated protein